MKRIIAGLLIAVIGAPLIVYLGLLLPSPEPGTIPVMQTLVLPGLAGVVALVGLIIAGYGVREWWRGR